MLKPHALTVRPSRLFVALTLALSATTFAGVALAAAGSASDAHIPPPQDTPYPGTIQLHVDASDITQDIVRVHETIPVQAGELTLFYPQWIPGDHEPSGPIDKLAGLTITANGKPLAWTRYKYDVYAFKLDVPQGVSSIDVQFQYLSAGSRGQGPIEMTPDMLDLSWDEDSLYPAGYYTRDIKVVPSVTLPAGWKFGTALEVASQSGDTATFKPTTYNTLVDSPIFTPAACEGTSTLFEVPYFDMGKAFLTQSGQLYGEAAAMAVGKAYVFGPTFRAEKSKTRRHLTEFWMVEPEVAFMDLNGDMDLAEDMLVYIVQTVLAKHRTELEKVLERVQPAPAGPGRPRLGVVSREVSLLPAQWDWLEAQPSGISATLRQLIEAARRKTPGAERARMARDAAYRFMTAMAGDRPGFEAALRALYAGEKSIFEHRLRRWPADIRRHAERLAAPSFE